MLSSVRATHLLWLSMSRPLAQPFGQSVPVGHGTVSVAGTMDAPGTSVDGIFGGSDIVFCPGHAWAIGLGNDLCHRSLPMLL